MWIAIDYRSRRLFKLASYGIHNIVYIRPNMCDWGSSSIHKSIGTYTVRAACHTYCNILSLSFFFSLPAYGLENRIRYMWISFFLLAIGIVAALTISSSVWMTIFSFMAGSERASERASGQAHVQTDRQTDRFMGEAKELSCYTACYLLLGHSIRHIIPDHVVYCSGHSLIQLIYSLFMCIKTKPLSSLHDS